MNDSFRAYSRDFFPKICVKGHPVWRKLKKTTDKNFRNESVVMAKYLNNPSRILIEHDLKFIYY